MHILPYVYFATNRITREFYIGYRKANKEPAHIDFPKYKTSAKQVKDNFDQFDWYIVAEFFDAESAYDFEQQLIHENLDNPLIINRSCFHGKRHFKRYGTLSDNHKRKISETKTGELNPNFGKVYTQAERDKISTARKGIQTHLNKNN